MANTDSIPDSDDRESLTPEMVVFKRFLLLKMQDFPSDAWVDNALANSTLNGANSVEAICSEASRQVGRVFSVPGYRNFFASYGVELKEDMSKGIAWWCFLGNVAILFGLFTTSVPPELRRSLTSQCQTELSAKLRPYLMVTSKYLDIWTAHERSALFDLVYCNTARDIGSYFDVYLNRMLGCELPFGVLDRSDLESQGHKLAYSYPLVAWAIAEVFIGTALQFKTEMSRFRKRKPYDLWTDGGISDSPQKIGYVPKRLDRSGNVDLSMLPANILYGSVAGKAGEAGMAHCLYLPDLTTYKENPSEISMIYRDELGGGNWVRITYERSTGGWTGEKSVGGKTVSSTFGSQWEGFFQHLTLNGLSNGERCEFEKLKGKSDA